MANAIPGDIDGFLGATILEFTTVSGWQDSIVILIENSVQIFEVLSFLLT